MDVRTGKEVRSLAGLPSQVHGAFSPDGTLLAIAGQIVGNPLAKPVIQLFAADGQLGCRYAVLRDAHTDHTVEIGKR